MRVPRGVDANPYQLTEPRELVLRNIATEANVIADGRQVPAPLPLSAVDVTTARRWLREHGYLDEHARLTSRGLQVAAHLSRMDRHDPITEPGATLGPDGKVTTGTRVRCSCGWGGARNEQGPGELRVPYRVGQGGRQVGERLHAAHVREAKGEPEPAPKARRDPFAGLPAADDDIPF